MPLSFFSDLISRIKEMWCGVVGYDDRAPLSAEEFMYLLNISPADTRRITNARQILESLKFAGYDMGLNQPHRLAMYLAQIGHESGSFFYDKEVWGPTPAQKRYDTRTDLGNTAAIDGDGFKYRGRTAIQITGKWNYFEFYEWCFKLFGKRVPDFVKFPDKVNDDPWEGLGPIWYWTTRKLNDLADEGSFKSITRIINGGYNGLTDREGRYGRIGLKMLGYGPSPASVREFQSDHGLTIDGIMGNNSRGKMHHLLKDLPAYKFPEKI